MLVNTVEFQMTENCKQISRQSVEIFKQACPFRGVKTMLNTDDILINLLGMKIQQSLSIICQGGWIEHFTLGFKSTDK